MFLDLSNTEKMKDFQAYRGELELRSTHLLPSGIPVRREFIEGFYALKQELEAIRLNVWGVKGEVTGPITEAYSITILPRRNKVIHEDDIFDVVLKTTCEVASWISSKIIETTRKVVGKGGLPIFFVDEPLLPLVLREYDIEVVREALERVLRKVKCRRGVHVCDDPASVIDMMLELEVDYFSFDLRRYPKTLEMADKERLKQHIEEGRGLAFGVTPNTPESIMDEETLYMAHRGKVNIEELLPTSQKIAETVINGLEAMRGRLNVEELAMNSLITPQCGFRSFTVPNPEEGERLVKILLERQEAAAQIIRKKYRFNEK
ncbi:MAG: hypothetical protein KIH01_00245 [Candidatus Freyarchaeota archaeon]|nr:hypothetical protein [Candidatus Jordarchaeia archaeon]